MGGYIALIRKVNKRVSCGMDTGARDRIRSEGGGGGVNSGGMGWGKGTDKLTVKTPKLNVVFTGA
jgi:hypothetical protein